MCFVFQRLASGLGNYRENCCQAYFYFYFYCCSRAWEPYNFIFSTFYLPQTPIVKSSKNSRWLLQAWHCLSFCSRQPSREQNQFLPERAGPGRGPQWPLGQKTATEGFLMARARGRLLSSSEFARATIILLPSQLIAVIFSPYSFPSYVHKPISPALPSSSNRSRSTQSSSDFSLNSILARHRRLQSAIWPTLQHGPWEKDPQAGSKVSWGSPDHVTGKLPFFFFHH